MLGLYIFCVNNVNCVGNSDVRSVYFCVNNVNFVGNSDVKSVYFLCE